MFLFPMLEAGCLILDNPKSEIYPCIKAIDILNLVTSILVILMVYIAIHFLRTKHINTIATTAISILMKKCMMINTGGIPQHSRNPVG